jgi:metal-responsive CopG/Arc/MetJ family transcriptional regulator
MGVAKIAVSLDSELVRELDALVREHKFTSRSQAIQKAVMDSLARRRRTRLARECAKLDKRAEQKTANEYFTAEQETWPEY